MILVSVHIPKTAGTSFRDSLESNTCVISDYGDSRPQTSDIVQQDITVKDTQVFIPPIGNARVIKVYDGDTFTIATKMPQISKTDIYRFSVRIKHIDCPELRTKNDNEKKVAQIAKEYVYQAIYNKVIQLSNITYDKYGRLCCDVFYKNRNIGKELIQNHLAVPYEGKTKISPTDWLEFYKEKHI